jgi:hypothetical protein
VVIRSYSSSFYRGAAAAANEPEGTTGASQAVSALTREVGSKVYGWCRARALARKCCHNWRCLPTVK